MATKLNSYEGKNESTSFYPEETGYNPRKKSLAIFNLNSVFFFLVWRILKELTIFKNEKKSSTNYGASIVFS